MNHQIHIQYYDTPFGELILGAYKEQLCLCDWKYRYKRKAIDSRIQKGLNTQYIEVSSPVIEKTKLQLNEYFKCERSYFDIPLLTIGSDFQKIVWLALLQIPYGKTNTYSELSHQLKNPKAIRAIAAANGANALSIIIPCHRIIGSNGDLIGYAGGIPAKRDLLQLEGSLATGQLELFK